MDACVSSVNYLVNAVCQLQLKRSRVCQAYELFGRRRVSALANTVVCISTIYIIGRRRVSALAITVACV